MKILLTEQIRSADKNTAEKKGILSHELMETASRSCFIWISSAFPAPLFNGTVRCFCGTGNNGGDGLAVARMLHENGYDVKAYVVKGSEPSSDFRKNEELFKNLKGSSLEYIEDKSFQISFSASDLIIDAMLGSGLSRPVSGLISDVIYRINTEKAASRFKVIAIDIATGLYADKSSADNKYVVNTDYTLTFELPKLAFFMPENAPYVGEWHVLSIGLDADFINSQETKFNFTDIQLAQSLIRRRSRFSHKGSFGHSLLLGGSYGKIGAMVLAAKGCLRSGTGLLTVYTPSCGYNILQISVPESLAMTDQNEKIITEAPKVSEKYNAIGIGPGMGVEEETAHALKNIIQNATVPLVIDADAINIISENKTWLHFVPAETIFTPHPKEFERLAGKWGNDFDRLQLQINFSLKFRVYVVLKGAYTSVSFPDGTIYFNSTGNPGMATGGSGDVLTGIITGLIAQGYSPGEACIAGTFLHGLAGDLAEEDEGVNALTASDITDYLGKAFLLLTPESITARQKDIFDE